jgi:hypothetical protein
LIIYTDPWLKKEGLLDPELLSSLRWADSVTPLWGRKYLMIFENVQSDMSSGMGFCLFQLLDFGAWISIEC